MTEKRVGVEITLRIFIIDTDNVDGLLFYNVCVFVFV